VSQSASGEHHEYQDGHVRVIRAPLSGHSAPMETEIAQWIAYSTQLAVAIRQLHEDTPLDVIDFPEWGCEGYVFLLNRTPRTRIPTAIHLHGPLVMFAHALEWPEPESDFYRVGTHMEGTCLRLAEAVFSSSQCSAAWCAKHYGIPREQIPILHTGVDTQLFRPNVAAKSRHPTIAFAGKIARNKGVQLLLDAASQLTDEFPTLRLVMLGRGEREVIEELRTCVARRGLEQMLDLRGFVRREELPQHLAQAHVFAAPSTYEGGPGLVYLEAMACGLPVIACAGSGAAEVVQQGHNGFLVTPLDVSALTSVLSRLLADTQLRETLGHQAREYAVTHGDSELCLDRLESFYQQVARTGACRSERIIGQIQEPFPEVALGRREP